MNDRSSHRAASTLAVVILVAGSSLIPGCIRDEIPLNYVARVGDRYLLEEDVLDALEGISIVQDSSDARRMVIDRWITMKVLHQEALRRGLAKSPAVQRRLQEVGQSILVQSLLDRLYEEHDLSPSAGETQTYFERHKNQFRLREPFVRVRYLQTYSLDDAVTARRALEDAPATARDSVWSAWMIRVNARAARPDEDEGVRPSDAGVGQPNGSTGMQTAPMPASVLSMGYYPERRLFADKLALHQALVGLSRGETAPVIEIDSTYHVLQLANRVPEGSIPEHTWIQDELTRLIVTQRRKQLYARQVQRLRNEALVRQDLDIR